MKANPHINPGTVLGFTSSKGVDAYVYIARRPRNANYGLGYLFVADRVDPQVGLVADDAVGCCHMGLKDTVAGWPVVNQQPHDDAEWPNPLMYEEFKGLADSTHYRLVRYSDQLRHLWHQKSTAEDCYGRPRGSAFHGGAVPYYLDEVVERGHGQFRDMRWWQALKAGDPRETSLTPPSD